jgi:hypothetical protein
MARLNLNPSLPELSTQKAVLLQKDRGKQASYVILLARPCKLIEILRTSPTLLKGSAPNQPIYIEDFFVSFFLTPQLSLIY